MDHTEHLLCIQDAVYAPSLGDAMKQGKRHVPIGSEQVQVLKCTGDRGGRVGWQHKKMGFNDDTLDQFDQPIVGHVALWSTHDSELVPMAFPSPIPINEVSASFKE
jgi:hypothetical protein